MATSERERCPCGRPLHYNDPKVEQFTRRLVAKHGECVRVTTPTGTYMVSRHYISLHGLAAVQLPSLADIGIVERIF